MLIGFLWAKMLKLRGDWMVYAKLFKLRVDKKQKLCLLLVIFSNALARKHGML